MLIFLMFVSFNWILEPSYADNSRPIIAVLAQLAPIDKHYSYIAASYVKYLESAGARVLPVPANSTSNQVRKIFQYVNGVLFPGGSVKWFVSGYYEHAKLIFDLAIKANDKGDYFPIWGTCLGFETLHVITTAESDVLNESCAEDISLPLNFTSEALNSQMFGGIDVELYNALQKESITYNHHSFGVYPNTYKVRPDLNKFFKILSTNYDKKKVEFVSSIESFNYPIYGTQWHPEKNPYEFSVSENLPHSKAAIQITQYLANFFVDEARKNNHLFPSAAMEDEYLIYRYETFKTGGKPGRLENFEQVYLFPGGGSKTKF